MWMAMVRPRWEAVRAGSTVPVAHHRRRPSSSGSPVYLIDAVATRPADSQRTKYRISSLTCGAKGTRTPAL